MQKCPPPALRAFRIELPDGRGYWSVVDDEYAKVAVADRFLFDLRFGRDRAESTTRAYAGELARFLSWCTGTGRSLEQGARDLSRFVLTLRATPIERRGAGQLKRMDITGARWGLDGAEAVLKLRALRANGDWGD